MRLVLRETALSFRRAPVLSLLSITTIAFALFVVGLVGLVALNLRQTLGQLAERVEVVAYLMHGTPIEVVTVALADVQAFPGVESATYLTRDEALERVWLACHQSKMERHRDCHFHGPSHALDCIRMRFHARVHTNAHTHDHIRGPALLDGVLRQRLPLVQSCTPNQGVQDHRN